jgi:hypothetical protein
MAKDVYGCNGMKLNQADGNVTFKYNLISKCILEQTPLPVQALNKLKDHLLAQLQLCCLLHQLLLGIGGCMSCCKSILDLLRRLHRNTKFRRSRIIWQILRVRNEFQPAKIRLQNLGDLDSLNHC